MQIAFYSNIIQQNITWLGNMIELKDSPVKESSTHVEGVDFVIRSRYAAGKKLPIPYFRVTLDKEMRVLNNADYSYVSIAKHGWKTAWKKALLSLTAKKGRCSVVRFLSRPPRESEYPFTSRTS